MSKKKKNITQRTIAHTPASAKVTGTDEWSNTETGETIKTVTVLQQTSDINFTKVWISNLLYSLEIVGGSKIKVVNYILDNLNYSENILIATHDKIAKETGVSARTVGATIRLLRETNFLDTKPGVIMVNPDVLAKGSNNKRNSLLIKFNDLNEKE